MTTGVGRSFIPPETEAAIRARGLPVTAHLSPATEPQRDDGRRADLTNWQAAYLACQASSFELRKIIRQLDSENALLRAGLAGLLAESRIYPVNPEVLAFARADRRAALAAERE